MGNSSDDASAGAILDEVCGFIEKLGMGGPDLAPSMLLVDELELDSLDWVDLAKELEERFGVMLRDRNLRSLETVGDVAQLIRVRIGGSGAGPG